MLDVSATQELAKNLDAEDVEIKELRAANEALAKKLADVEAAEKALQAKDAVREARLTKLEARIAPGRRHRPRGRAYGRDQSLNKRGDPPA